MPNKVSFSPVELILLLEISSLAKVIITTDARNDALIKLQKLNLIKDSHAHDTTWNCTEKGITFIEKLKTTSLPIRKWTYENE